jgi:hypothetical protein
MGCSAAGGGCLVKSQVLGAWLGESRGDLKFEIRVGDGWAADY